MAVRETKNPRTRRIFQVELSDDSRLSILALSQSAAENIVAKQAKRENWKSAFDGKPLTVVREGNNKQNPRDQFLLVDADLNPIARSFDYDLLQDKADRHNEESDGDFYYVIKARDHEIMKREKRGSRENPRPHSAHGTAQVEDARGVRYVISYTSRESIESILRRASDFYGVEMVNILKRTPTIFAPSRKRNAVSQELKDAIEAESETLAQESEALRGVVGNPRNGAGISKDYTRRGFDYVTLNTGQDGSGNTVYVVQWKTTKDKWDGRKNLGQLTFTTQAEAENYIKHGLRSKNGRARNDEYSKLDFFDDKVDEISAEFTGEISGESMRASAPDHTPAKVSRLGQLRLIKVAGVDGKQYDLKFAESDDAWLVADRRKNLHFVGKDTSLRGAMKLPKRGHLALLGNAIQVDYFTTKRHIESARPTYFYHELGEVDGITPAIYIDDEGFLRLFGGNYDIWTCGIVN